MKKYLIIGGAGFIGSHLSKTLLAQKDKVVVVDVAVKEPMFGSQHYAIDVADAKKLAKVFEIEKPDVVFFLAGPINLRKPIGDPLFLRDLNFLMRTKIMLDTCKHYHVKKIIFISSGGAVYQDATKIPTKENYPSHPTSLYGLANLAIEKYIQDYCSQHNLQFTIGRLSNAYGPGQWESGFVPAVILKMMRKKRPVIYGSGRQTRDFVYISDVVSALIALAQKGQAQVYNIGSGKEINLNGIFLLTKHLFGVKVKPMYKKVIFPETKRSAVDIKKIKKELGFSPKTSLKQGLLKTIEYYTFNHKNAKP